MGLRDVFALYALQIVKITKTPTVHYRSEVWQSELLYSRQQGQILQSKKTSIVSMRLMNDSQS